MPWGQNGGGCGDFDMDQEGPAGNVVLFAHPTRIKQMPFEAVVVVTIVTAAFSLLMGTLAWAVWYTKPVVQS